jgi:hypothetical protein
MKLPRIILPVIFCLCILFMAAAIYCCIDDYPFDFGNNNFNNIIYGILLMGFPVAVLFTMTGTLRKKNGTAINVITVMFTVIVAVASFFYIAINSMWYHFDDVMVLPESAEMGITISDSIHIEPHLNYVGHHEGDRGVTLEAIVCFYLAKDSLKVNYLSIEMTCINNPEHILELYKVYTVSDTLPPFPQDLKYVVSKNFTGLPGKYKTISAKRPGQGFYFCLSTNDFNSEKNYKYTITGSGLYHGKTINFSKEILAEHKRGLVETYLSTTD